METAVDGHFYQQQRVHEQVKWVQEPRHEGAVLRHEQPKWLQQPPHDDGAETGPNLPWGI